MNQEQVSSSHLGYLCHARKVAVVRNLRSQTFTVEDMARINDAPLSASTATFKVCYQGNIEPVDTPLGRYGRCDFSSVTRPGIYRVVLPETNARSYQFTVADGVYFRLPYLFLDFVHELRSGFYTDDLRRPLTLDDGVRTDTGEAWDAVGGWYDAGDLRKWMAHSTLPALAFFDVAEHLRLNRRLFGGAYPVDWLAEAAWGVEFILKMLDPATGMIMEDVGGGDVGRRREGMSWWYENHAGCYADNADNRFTDNIPVSGDERKVRALYNPIVQYTNLAILACAYAVYAAHDPELARRCQRATLAVWNFCQSRLAGEEHGWTAVRAWRLCAALELYRAGLLGLEPVEASLLALLANFDENLGFWKQSAVSDEPYRAILHSAQPLIALAKYLELAPAGRHAGRVRETLAACYRLYVEPMARTNPYRFIPFGVYSAPATPLDRYRPWRDRWVFRFCMPVHHPQQINHGLGGHWMSWAHGLAQVGQLLADPAWTELAWAQIEWLLGNNDLDISVVTGVGYNNPMPHSRFLGTLPGGFMNGFRGTEADIPTIDLAREAEWNSTEYWNVPLSNCLMALARLLPVTVPLAHKLG